MRALLALIAAAVLVGCSSRANVEIDGVWVRATPPGATVAAVYAQVTARQADEIVAISSPLASNGEIHTTTESNGIVTMRPVNTVSLPSGVPVKFESGGVHVMLIGLREPLAAGDTLPVTFTFKSAAPMTVQADIVAPGDAPLAH